MLRNTVKASEVSHLTDARYFAAWEVAYIGFPIGSTGLNLAEMNAIREWIEGPQVVGEWSPADPLPPAEQLAAYRLDVLQLSQVHEPSEVAAAAQLYELPIWVEYVPNLSPNVVREIQQFLENRASFADCFVLNLSKAGIAWPMIFGGNSFTPQDIIALTNHYPILLDVDGAYALEIHQFLPKMKGFSVRGGEEEKVGYKDYNELDEFFEELEV